VSPIEKGSHGIDVVRLLPIASALSLPELLDLASSNADRVGGLPL
jgi:hypothetical protein